MNVNLRTKKKSVIWVITLTQLSLLLNLSIAPAQRGDVSRGFTPGRPTPPGMMGGDPTRRPPPEDRGDSGSGFEGPNSPFFGDEDEDEEEDFVSRFPRQPGGGTNPGRPGGNPNRIDLSPNSPNSRAYSAGGQPRSDGPEPRKTSGGYSIGGQPANGVISNPTKIEPARVDDETAEGSKEIVTDFNFPDADILDLAKALGKLTGKNFVLDKEVKGRVNIITNSPITVSQAWKLFLTALDVNGFALIPSGAYLRIAKQRDARDKQLKTYTGDFSPDTDALITRVFNLKYISAEEVTRTFRSLMPATSRIIGYEQTNTVIVTDTGTNITRLAKLLEILDVEGFDAGIEVIPVKYASAAELSKLIDALIPGTSAGTGMGGPPGSPPGMPRLGGGGRFSARRTKEGGIINTIIADERTNTLIVHANSKGADQVRELVAKLDQRAPTSIGGGKVRVVYLQYADAEQIANTLNNFSTQSNRSMPSPAGGGGTGSNPIAGSLFEGSIKISPDKATNSLVITASPSDFVTVQRVINQLDIPREQVYVEVVVMEVSVSKGFNFSANAAAPGSFLSSILGVKDISALLNGPLGVMQTPGALVTIPIGSRTTFTSPTGTTIPNIPSSFAILKAAQSDSSLNVLATPQIIALDNTEAVFESTEKVPIPNTTTTANGLANTGFQYQPVTLSIKIKPQINKIINFVKLDVTTKLGDINYSIVPKNLQDTVPGTTERSAQTTVVVGDSDTIVLGGLIRDQLTESVNKIPILGDIPILGWLFKGKSTSLDKRNLLIFMTPHIVRQYDKVRTILDKKLKERDEFLESTTGGVDPLKKKRDSIIRSLPDLKELGSKHPPTTVVIDEEKSPNSTTAPAATAVPPSSGSAPSNSSQSPSTQPLEEPQPVPMPLPDGPIPVPPPGESLPEANMPPALEVPPPAPESGGGGSPEGQ